MKKTWLKKTALTKTWLKRINIVALIVMLMTLIISITGCGFFDSSDQTEKSEELKDRYESWDDSFGQEITMVYNEETGLQYDMYIPNELANKDLNSQTMMILLHGGGWINGDRSREDYLARRYAKEGYIVLNMDYSLLSESDRSITLQTMLDEISLCANHGIACLLDEGIGVKDMVVGGESSGGHISLMYDCLRYETSPVPIKFAIDYVGPTSLDLSSWLGISDYINDKDEVARRASLLSGNDISATELENKSPEVQRALDLVEPFTKVSKDMAPLILVYGGKDTTVPPVHQELLMEALDNENCEYYSFYIPEAKHAMYKFSDTEVYQDMWTKTLEMMDKK